MPVARITTTVALAKSPNAMPEFCTWWIQNGPTTWTPSSSASRLVTRYFVSWSAAIAANAIAASAAHCAAPAASERCANETGDEPVRR